MSSSSRCSATRDGCPVGGASPPPSSGSSPPTPTRPCPPTPPGTPSTPCPDPAFDHAEIVAAARDRLRAKLSYTNLGFALAPREFTISTLREHYAAALGHPVSATNLQRVLARRSVLVPTGALAAPGPAGGRPAALFRFAEPTLRVTDAFAVLRPPGEQTRAALP